MAQQERTTRLERSVAIQAEPAEVYALVSDLPRMAEWSPECTRVAWKGGATGPAPGARFVGFNRVGPVRWLTQGVITEADPGHTFAFAIHFGPIPVALWEYVVTPSPAVADVDRNGTVLTERWTDRRPAPLRFAMDRLFGPRSGINARGIEKTLAALKAAAESPSPA